MLKNNLIKYSIIIHLIFTISLAKIQFIPENGEATPLDSIFIYVPRDSSIGKQIIHCVSDSEYTQILLSKNIEVVDIFNSNSNDTLELVNILEPPYKNWNIVKISHLNTGFYRILWEGKPVMTYKVGDAPPSTQIACKGSNKFIYKDEQKMYLLNGRKVIMKYKFMQTKKIRTHIIKD